MNTHRLLPYLLILTSGVVWGGTFSLTLVATAEGAHPLGISAWQATITAGLFAGYCLLRRIPFFQLKHIYNYVVIALVGVTLPNLAYYYAAPHLSAGILSITVASVPLLTYALMLGLRYETAVTKRVLGIVLGMAAILLLVLPDQGLSSADANFWIILVVLGSGLYAVENVYVEKGVAETISVYELLCGANLLGMCLQFPLVMVLGIAEPPSWLLTKAGLALGGIALSSALACSLFMITIRMAGSVFASQCAYIVTISGVLWGIVLFAEQHSIWVWSSVVVMLIGLVLVTPKKQQQAH